MDFSKVVRARHSVRDFDGRPVPESVIRQIVSEAGMAPSWADSQPWRVYCASGKTMERIRKSHESLVAAGTRGSADFTSIHRTLWGAQARRNMAGFSEQLRETLNPKSAMSSEERAARRGETAASPATPSADPAARPAHPGAMRMANGRLFNTGTALYLTLQRRITSWNVLDLGAFMQTLALSAKARGYDTMIAYEFVRFPAHVKRILGIPGDEILAIGMAVGHASNAPINSLRARRMGLDRFLRVEG